MLFELGLPFAGNKSVGIATSDLEAVKLTQRTLALGTNYPLYT